MITDRQEVAKMGFSEFFGKVTDTVMNTGKQVGGAVSDKAKEAREYARDAVEVANLKNQISSN